MSINEEEVYQEHVLDHYEDPYHRGRLAEVTHAHEDDNPLCGDKISVYVKLNGEVIEDVSFQGSGCAISQSSASLMTTAVRGRSVEEAMELFVRFHEMVTSDAESPVDKEKLGKLRAFGGVREFPSRVKCANLSWHTLRSALEARTESVTTE